MRVEDKAIRFKRIFLFSLSRPDDDDDDRGRVSSSSSSPSCFLHFLFSVCQKRRANRKKRASSHFNELLTILAYSSVGPVYLIVSHTVNDRSFSVKINNPMITKIILLIPILILLRSNVAQVPTNIRILSSEKDFLRLGWTKPDRIDSIYGYTIKYRPINSNTSWTVRQTRETEIVLNELRPITKYEIILQAHSNSSYTESAGPSTRIEAITDETGKLSYAFLFSRHLYDLKSSFLFAMIEKYFTLLCRCRDDRQFACCSQKQNQFDRLSFVSSDELK